MENVDGEIILTGQEVAFIGLYGKIALAINLVRQAEKIFLKNPKESRKLIERAEKIYPGVEYVTETKQRLFR